MVATQKGLGRPTLAVRFFQLTPPSRVSHSWPSSVPAHRTSGLRGHSARAVALALPLLVVSGEMALKSSPRFTERNTKLPAQYTVVGLCRDTMIGVFQLNRSGCPPARTRGLMKAASPVLMLRRTMLPSCDSA